VEEQARNIGRPPACVMLTRAPTGRAYREEPASLRRKGTGLVGSRRSICIQIHDQEPSLGGSPGARSRGLHVIASVTSRNAAARFALPSDFVVGNIDLKMD
jgi:hypothetical protein